MLISRRRLGTGLVGGALAAATRPARAGPPASIRIGVLHAMTGPISVIAREQMMGLELALTRLGNRLGGVPVELFEEDARMTPDTGLQAATRLIEQRHIDILVGNQLSNQLLAYIAPLAAANVVVFTDLPGPSQLAGAGCTPDLFVMSWENNTNSAAIGLAMTAAGVKRAYFISQNYVTGREYVAGARKFYHGEVAGEAYLPIEQTDYAAEIAAIRAARPDAVYVFLPGAGGIAFLKQFAGAGLKARIPLFSGSWLADEHSFAALGAAAEGAHLVANWFADLDNPQNVEFVAAFVAKFGRRPVVYAAMTYDNMMLLDRAVASLGGDISDRDALRRAIRGSDFQSVRGPFAFNVNQFPIQNYYAAEVVRSDGELRHKVTATIASGFKDGYFDQCHMPR